MLLQVHSYYSLRFGTLSVEKLTDALLTAGYTSIALTDIHSTCAYPEMVGYCEGKGLKVVAGAEFRNEKNLLYLLIARNNKGFEEINDLITKANCWALPYPIRPAVQHCYVIYPFEFEPTFVLQDHEFWGVSHQNLTRYRLQKRPKHQCVALVSVSFEKAQDFELHRKLRAIDRNTVLSRIEANDCASPADWIRPANSISALFDGHEDLVQQAQRLLDSSELTIDWKGVKNKKTYTHTAQNDRLLLEKLALDGMKYRYGKDNKVALERVQKELKIIDELGFNAYFLITWDIIRYSLSRGFYHVGRGSGANSVVAYCLRITDVCPIELDLYFERFLNPKRKTPPDFDIDYSWKDRNEVIDYIFKRYGKEHTALLGAMSTFKDRSMIRELGKVSGLPKSELDGLIRAPQQQFAEQEATQQLLEDFPQLADLPNVRSIHAGGILISEEPLTRYCALEMPPKGFQTTQFDMYTAEDIGFEKLDILSQRVIGHIKDSALLVYKTKGIKVDVHAVAHFKQDEAIKNLLRKGLTIGCFYVESPAMRGLLKKLRCDNYLSLVAASSIIRPGVASSGMMRQYIQRFHNPNGFEYLHPVLKEQLQETYGVMVYQEDVLKVCHHFADLDLADADVLRRMMSGKSRNKKHLNEIVQKFFDNCAAKGFDPEVVKEVWRQIESFAGYSFSKAHSASYAVESYQSLYLKAHYPVEFMVGVINNFGGFYNTKIYVHEAKRWGAKIKLPCVNFSEVLTTIENDFVYLGFVHVKGLEEALITRMLQERKENGAFASLDDFMERVKIGQEQLTLLIRCGAFGFTGIAKKALLWKAQLLLHAHVDKVGGLQLFERQSVNIALPALQYDVLEDGYDELELFGFTVSVSPFDFLRTKFRGDAFGSNLLEHVGKTLKFVGDFVTTKYVRTRNGQVMYFGTFLDEHGDFLDTVHFPDSAKAYPFKGAGVYLLLGKVVEEFGFASIEVSRMEKLPLKPDPRIE